MQTKFGFILFMFTGSMTAIFYCYLYPEAFFDIEPPEIPDQYFGRGRHLRNPDEFPKDNTAIKKFKIHIEDSVIKDLKERLNNTRYVQPLDNVAFQYGFHSAVLKKIVRHWATKYDWREHEKVLNKFSHYVTQIEGINVHFIHEKPKVKAGEKVHVLPLLLVHGWPGSIAEFTKLIPLLTTPLRNKEYAFEIIAPSIPGYGFSEAPHQPGFSVTSAARVFLKLMDRLGFKKFYAQGGDWGSFITLMMAKLYPKRVVGVHVNMVPMRFGPLGMLKYTLGAFLPSLFMAPEEQADVYPFWKLALFMLQESGYMHIQATKPDTVSSALSDSPAGLAAYILEKFSTWTDHTNLQDKTGGLTKNFNLDDLLTNVMIYWTTNTIASSTRFYKENVGEMFGLTPASNVPVKVPTGVAVFPHELARFPKSFLTCQLKNIVHYERMTRGGHFAAMEEPELLAEQIWKFAMIVEKQQKE